MIKIDKELSGLIPPLREDEYRLLESSILKEGCRDALILWGEVLIDGHNRYKICTEHNIPYEKRQMEFKNRDEVILWIMRNQLARRNLNDFQRVELVRKCEEAIKAQAKARQGTRNDLLTCGENYPQVDKKKQRANSELGAMAGVSRSTYEHATAVLDKAPEPIVEATRKQELSINAAYGVTKLPEGQKEKIASRIEHGESAKTVITDVKSKIDIFPVSQEREGMKQPETQPRIEEVETRNAVDSDVKRRPFVVNNSGNMEWYTPSEYVASARQVMGNIDLDPASCELANEIVKAAKYYTQAEDGLMQEWSGRVFMNPPYGLVEKFAKKLIEELSRVEQAIVLVNNATETEWFNELVKRARAICFPKGRMRFWNESGEGGASMQGQAILYFGEESECFIEEFKYKGWCALPKV